MTTQREPVLIAEIPSDSPDERLALVLQFSGARSQLQLCQQSWAHGIGWFTQSRVDVKPEQIECLRQALGTPKAAARPHSFPPGGAHSQFRVVG